MILSLMDCQIVLKKDMSQKLTPWNVSCGLYLMQATCKVKYFPSILSSFSTQSQMCVNMPLNLFKHPNRIAATELKEKIPQYNDKYLFWVLFVTRFDLL